MQRTGIPISIKAARLVDVASNKEFTLTTIANRHCHFAVRFPHVNYEIRFRIDWSDMNQNGDPMLDTDFYTPGETKPLKNRGRLKKAHHTQKTQNTDTELWIYDFIFDGLSLQLRLELTREHFITGCARIVPPDHKDT